MQSKYLLDDLYNPESPLYQDNACESTVSIPTAISFSDIITDLKELETTQMFP